MKRILSQFLLLLSINISAQVGIGTTNPESTLDINGSISANITSTSGNLTLDDTHHTIILSGNHNITLPAANSCNGRVYIIKKNPLPKLLILNVCLKVNLIYLGQDSILNLYI